jgi:hypothetical protein
MPVRHGGLGGVEPVDALVEDDGGGVTQRPLRYHIGERVDDME